MGFIPAGIFRSEGYDQYMTNIPISLRIFQSSDMHLVIELDSSISLINADSGDMKFPFPSRNSEGGTVDLTPGHYKLCIYSRLPDYVTCDPNQTNDTACTNFEILPAASVENPSNTIFSLTQNFPNPFSATTIIKYYLPENEKIVFRIIDAIGRIVYEKEEQEDSGQHELPITPEQFINGIFTYQLTGINDRGEISTISKKMILLK